MQTATLERNTAVRTKAPKADYYVGIVGSGFSGLGMAIRLREAGINSFAIFEAADEVGGTWRDNVYPGAACDVPSHLYSYSFEQNPNWSRMFARSNEIQNYILEIAEKHNLRPHIHFNSKVEQAVFNEDKGIWEVTAGGKTVTANIIVSAVGALSQPAIPEIKGREKFKGDTYHTARWSDDINLKGKKVAVIGSGASAIQLVPAIAPEVKELTVFQRTPSWIVPKADYEITESEQQLYRQFPVLQRMRRLAIYGITELLATAIVYDSPMTTLLQQLATWNIERYIKDPELRRKVTPKYRLGCKRMLISNDWYPALNRENVHLVDRGVDEITENGPVADGHEYDVDVIIWATGFEPPAYGAPFSVTGLNSRKLEDDWAEAIEAYRGVTITGYPNMFMLMGPNTGPGHTSVLVYTEAQMKYIQQAVKLMYEKDIRYLNVKDEKQREFNKFIDDRMKLTTWTSGCNSWYLNESGKNTTLYPGFASEYVLGVRNFNLSDYEVEY